MRRPIILALSLILSANGALAQKKPKAGDEKETKPGANMATTGGDPAENEKSDKSAPFKPKGKTGELAEEEGHAVEVKDVEKGRARDKLIVFGEVLIGFGKVPVPSFDNLTTGSATSVTLQVGGRYDFSPKLSAGLRVPWTTATVKQANTGDNQGSQALGAPELFAEYRLGLSRLTSLPIFFGVGVPVAQGNPDITSTDTAGKAQDIVNRVADGASGWKDSELFQPKRLPVVVGAGVRHERRAFELHALAKFVVLPDLGTELATPETAAGTFELNAVALREVTTLGGSYSFFDKPLIYAALDFSLVWSPLDTIEFESSQGATPPSRLQAVLEPRIGARFGKISPSVAYVAPIGGRLGDSGIGGLRLHVDVGF